MATIIRSGFPSVGAFIFEFGSESEARGIFGCDARSVLRILEKWGCDRAIVRVAGQDDTTVPIETIRLMSEFEPLVQLFFADTSLPPAVLRATAAKMDEDSRWGIVRISDQRQVVMSSGMSGVLLSGVSIDATTNWRRPEFWNPEHLRSFNAEWRDRLSEDGSNEIEYRYQIRKPGTSDSFEWYQSSYRLLRGEDGILYQVCSFRDRG